MEEWLVNLKVIGLQFDQAGPQYMDCFKGLDETISFLFYIFQIYVQLFLRNTLLQILLIESTLIEFKVYSKTDFRRNSHHEETSNSICIANHLTGFRIIRVSTGNFQSEL